MLYFLFDKKVGAVFMAIPFGLLNHVVCTAHSFIRYSGVWLITRCGSLMKYGYDMRDWNICLVKLVLTGVGSRILAYIYLITFGNK